MSEQARRVSIVHSSHVLKTIRNRGVSLFDGIKEAIDNSADWGANIIHIHASINKQDEMTVVIADDAAGIPDRVQVNLETGEGHPVPPTQTEGSVDGLLHALRMGGRIQRLRRNPTGRFGFGLPQTVVSFECTATIHTRTYGGQWRNLSLSQSWLQSSDAEDQETGRIMLPDVQHEAPQNQSMPIGWKFHGSGTMVTFADIPKKRHGFPNLSLFTELLKRDLGQTYRYLLADGLQIMLSTDGMIAASQIEQRDPLCLLEDSIDAKMFGPVGRDATYTLRFDGESGTRPLIMDPETEKPAEVTIKMVRIEPKQVRLALGIPLDARGLAPYSSKMEPWGFSMEGQGFSLVRGNREIGRSEDFSLFARDQELNYFRGEIHFPPVKELDRFFGVEPNKSKHNLSPIMRDWLSSAELELGTIRRETREARKALKPKRGPSKKANKRKSKPLSSKPMNTQRRVEKAASRPEIEDILPRRKPNKNQEALRQVRIALEEGDVELLESDYTARKQEHLDELRRAEEVSDVYVINEVQHQVANLEREYQKAKAELVQRFGEPAPFRTHERDRVDIHEAFYEVQHTDHGLAINFNRRHPMYDVYAHARDTNESMWLFLEALLYGIAHADADPNHSPEKRAFWDRIRPLMGRTSRLMLSLLDNDDEDEAESDNTGRRSKHDIVSSICNKLDMTVPKEMKGSTVPRSFLVDLVQNLGGPSELEHVAKQDLFRTAVEIISSNENHEKHLSRGGTVRRSGYLLLERALLE
ncbi:ATP-binding protein [Candidatus Poseidoniales archaeon]|nr:ATP-binding protein [Candidatus Poseidoniales archaeon]